MCSKCVKRTTGMLIVNAEGRLRQVLDKLTEEDWKDPYYQLELQNLIDMMEKITKKFENK